MKCMCKGVGGGGRGGRAIGTGPAATEPIFGQPTQAKLLYELQQVVKFLLQE